MSSLLFPLHPAWVLIGFLSVSLDLWIKHKVYSIAAKQHNKQHELPAFIIIPQVILGMAAGPWYLIQMILTVILGAFYHAKKRQQQQ